MKHQMAVIARMALALLWTVFSLSACRAAAVPTLPDSAAPPAQAQSTRAFTRAPVVTAPTASASAAELPPPLPPVEPPIIWYLRGSAPDDLLRVNAQLNRELAERGFQAQVELRVIEWATFEQHMADVEAANQPWDLVALPASSYPLWQEKDRLLPLTAYANPVTGRAENLFETSLPGLQTSLPAQARAGLFRMSQVSAVPNQGAWVRPRGVSIRADVVSALHLQADLERVQTYADLSPLLAKIQAAIADASLKDAGIANGEAIRRAAGLADLLAPENGGYDSLWGPLVTGYADAQLGVVNWYHTQAFLELAALRQAWQQAGYLPGEPLTPDQAGEGYRAGQYVVEVGRPVWPGSQLEQAQRYGYAWVDRPLAQPFLSTGAMLSSLTAVNARIADDPERVRRVLLFLDWLHTDAEIANLLAFGIEGQHWQWSAREEQVIALMPASRYHPDFTGQLGSRTLLYATDPRAAGMWAAVGRENARAAASTALGFRFDPRPVLAETAAVRGITLELLDPLANGQVEDIPKALRKLDQAFAEAGLATIQAELEQQLRAWKR